MKIKENCFTPFQGACEGTAGKFSSGHQRLDYMHVENAIDAMIHLVRSTPVRNTELFNVGSGQAQFEKFLRNLLIILVLRRR